MCSGKTWLTGSMSRGSAAAEGAAAEDGAAPTADSAARATTAAAIRSRTGIIVASLRLWSPEAFVGPRDYSCRGVTGSYTRGASATVIDSVEQTGHGGVRRPSSSLL